MLLLLLLVGVVVVAMTRTKNLRLGSKLKEVEGKRIQPTLRLRCGRAGSGELSTWCWSSGRLAKLSLPTTRTQSLYKCTLSVLSRSCGR